MSRRLRRLAAASATVVLALTVTACQNDEQPPPPELLEYVALGDSHAAAPRTPTTGLTIPCFRSDENYPHLVAEQLPRTQLTDVSCSGASSAAMLSAQETTAGTVPPQLDALSADTDLVTLNIGGNDASFFLDWARQCMQVAPFDPDGSPCADANQTPAGDPLLAKVPRIKANVSATLAEIEERSPDAVVIVVTYPKPFPDKGTCKLAARFATGDLTYINSISRAVSDAIIEAAREAGVGWVDVFRASRGHDICSDEPWTNGYAKGDIENTDQTRGNILHPFPEEQAAVAQLILDKIDVEQL